MDLKEVKSYLDQNKDSEDVKAFVSGFFTPDSVKNFLSSNDEGKKLVQTENETYFTKSLENWKQDNLTKLVEDEITKRYPAETEEQKKLRNLEIELQKEKQERVKSQLKTKAITHLTSKGIPLDLADYFIGADEETTAKHLEKLESVWTPALQAAVEGKFKENGREVPKGGNEVSSFKSEMSMEQYIAMREKEGI